MPGQFSTYEEYSLDLYNLLVGGIECTGHNPDYLEYEPFLASIEEMAETDDPEEQQYFYHPGHLGSSSFITDVNGDAHQHMQYLPYGEDFISQRIDWQTRYTFSAKEKDKNTGYHYFGARYYDSETSVWLSVDPLADKYPSMSPYMYTAGNPVMLVDPNGMETIARKQEKEDWFMNEKTGDVYYNSELKKGDEGKGLMQGNNWVHMGKNGMFNNSSGGGSDIEVNSQNKDLQTDSHSGKSSNNEAYYNGDNAENLMDRMGYDKKKKEYIYHKNIRQTHQYECGIVTTIDYSYYKIETWQYVKRNLKNKILKNTIQIGDYIEEPETKPISWNPRTYQTTSISRKRDT